MNENINLCEILKGHENETFYSRAFGNVSVYKILDNGLSISTPACEHNILYDKHGFIFDCGGEQDLFPSKDQHDWNEWYKEHNVPKTWSELVKTDKFYISCCGFGINSVQYSYNDIQDYADTTIEKSALALIKILQLIEVGYGGNVLCNKEGHWDGGIYGYTISIRPSSKTYLDGYEIIPIERRNDVVSPIMFKTKEYAQEFIKHEENCGLLRIFNMVAYPRDIK